MSEWENVFEKWRTYRDLDPDLKQDLEKMNGHRDWLEDAFYTELAFGTGGMRGVLGPGINRMNIYTVRKAVNGLANYLKNHFADVNNRGVAVSYDSRYMSRVFALETAKVLGAHGIKAYVFDTLHPTPLLSFAVRHLETVAGVMITASHNPPEYNGFKVYNEDGGQITPDEARDITGYIQQVEDELTVPYLDHKQLEEQNVLTWIGQEIDHAYLEKLAGISKLGVDEQNAHKDLQIVFTPLHGTAHDLVLKGLKQLNFQQVDVVEEQAAADPEFSTVESPNPEEPQAFTMAMELGKQTGGEILIGTDPDADRLGIAAKDLSGDYTVLTGNQLGALMLDYILSHSDSDSLKNGRMLKTIVTSELGRKIADYYGVKTIDTLTGFKYIGDKIRQFDETDETFIFGYEESYGYLISDFARDKDAVQAAVLAAEMAYYWKKKDKTLFDALHLLYETHGYYLEDMLSLTLKGKEGSEKIAAIMESIRKEPLQEIGGLQVESVEDYASGERTLKSGRTEPIDLPEENVVKFILDSDSWVCLRPSGTEPKIKCYFAVCDESEQAAKTRLVDLKAHMENVIHQI
ncbi:phospho-sugar mutase [Lentibacillus sp. CBA3610]|uniref:phospho-sugar mutase n=1 Tax=Lentibacillus sp. CBA3610 TaxID=2518176 RepID=UPI001595A2EB|nr:phospho-sugar mutase [Lentibacillus sp. CBA3610]QKY70535.1 phospho-sugar mutase [Lentibacillus sp. CBA3610]